MGAFPSHYNPPYNAADAPPLPYTTYPQYAAPAGPPPGHEDDDDAFVPPYDGKPPPSTVEGSGIMERMMLKILLRMETMGLRGMLLVGRRLGGGRLLVE